MSDKHRVTDQQYNGELNRFEMDLADTIAEGRLQAVQWNDLLTDVTTLTHLKEIGRCFIESNIGYLPPDEVLLPYEPYLRALIQQYQQNTISKDDFLQQAEDHLKLIRNADMKHNTCPIYDEAIYHNYRETFVPYGYAVRDRLTRILKYEPRLEHSLIAEMWFRNILSDQTYRLPDQITPDDIRAITVIKYREILLEKGKDAADALPLVSIE